MKNSKKGISLIVLVITIIVIIILAAAVLLSLQNNNPIDNSKNAVVNNDAAELKSALSLYVSNFMAKDANHASPFGENTVITISKEGTAANLTPATTVGATSPSSSTFTFSDLGVDSKSITSFTFNTSTNQYTWTVASGYPTIQ